MRTFSLWARFRASRLASRARGLSGALQPVAARPSRPIRVITPRRAQVLVGAHALLANGGVMAAVGAQLVALAAQRHAVPFVVLAGLHKLSPLFPHNPAITFNEFKVARTVCDTSVPSADLAQMHVYM